MQLKTRGIVIGKFYPPHKGHKYLIEVGKSQVDELTVIVCEKKEQKIPGKLRAEWIKEMVPGVNVLVIDDFLADDDSRGWAEYTIQILGYKPDVVFTSEDYGYNYAKFMGCRHVLVDKERKNVPVSATKIREDPWKYWEYLDPCVQSYFIKRVCVVGAESTGTTTMAKALAEHYKTVWVPEFGRMYWEGKMPAINSSKWKTDEFSFIAKKQNEIEDYLARIANKIIFCDTDSFATALWHERYMKSIAKEVDNLSVGRNPDLYLLTDVDIPFVQDGTRDGEHIRHTMHKRFETELKKHGKSYILLSGGRETRLKKAISACDKILCQTSRL